MHRLSIRSRFLPIVLTLLLGTSGQNEAHAQVAPKVDPSLILSGPIRSVAPQSVPVELVRVFLSLEADWTRSAGTASIWAAAGPDSVLILNVADLEVLSVSTPEFEGDPNWRVDRGKLHIDVPESAVSSWRVDVSYRVASALRTYQASGDVAAFWTSSLPGRATWMPLPADEIAAADYHVSIAAPADWQILISGEMDDPTLELDGRMIARTEYSSVFPRAVGFLAWDPDAESGIRNGRSVKCWHPWIWTLDG